MEASESLWHLKRFDLDNVNSPSLICNVYACSFEEALEKMKNTYGDKTMTDLKKDQIRLESEDQVQECSQENCKTVKTTVQSEVSECEVKNVDHEELKDETSK